MILRTRNITKIWLVLSVQTNLQRGSGPVVLLHEGDNVDVNPEDVRLEHLHQALYRLLPQHQVRHHPGIVRPDACGTEDPGARPVSNA